MPSDLQEPLVGNLRQTFLDLLQIVQPSGLIHGSRAAIAKSLGISERSLRHSLGKLETLGVVAERGVNQIRLRLPFQAFHMDFSQLALEGIDASGSNLCQAKCVETKLLGANLRQATIFCASFDRARLDGADMRGLVNSFGANFTMANLEGAQLSDSQLSFSEFAEAQLQKADVSNCNLTQTDFTNADCRGADFREADLSGAQLIGTDFRGAKLRGVKWLGATLKGAQLDDEALLEAATAGTLLG